MNSGENCMNDYLKTPRSQKSVRIMSDDHYADNLLNKFPPPPPDEQQSI